MGVAPIHPRSRVELSMSAARVLRCACASAFAALLGASSVAAHDQPFSWADLRLEPTALELGLTVHRIDAASAIGVPAPESLMSAPFLAQAGPKLAGVLAARLQLSAGAQPLALEWESAEPVPDRTAIVLRYRAPMRGVPGRLHVHARLFPQDLQHETFLNVYQDGRVVGQAVLDASRSDTDVFTRGDSGAIAVLETFIPAGIQHIFIGPDHILFVIGLLLLGGSLSRLVKIVTGFTIAHSLTLALATLNIVNPPARLIEPLIALSIVFVGLDNLRTRGRGPDRRALIAFAFGFVHGFGFASVLREFGLPRESLGWSLLGFNLGVEAGQACIVLAVAPLLAVLRAHAARIAPRVVAAGSWGVAIAGAWWFTQRVLVHG